jgi:hypothetical protein
MKERMEAYVKKNMDDPTFRTGNWERTYGIQVMFCVYELFKKEGTRTKRVMKDSEMLEAYQLRREILKGEHG